MILIDSSLEKSRVSGFTIRKRELATRRRPISASVRTRHHLLEKLDKMISQWRE